MNPTVLSTRRTADRSQQPLMDISPPTRAWLTAEVEGLVNKIALEVLKANMDNLIDQMNKTFQQVGREFQIHAAVNQALTLRLEPMRHALLQKGVLTEEDLHAATVAFMDCRDQMNKLTKMEGPERYLELKKWNSKAGVLTIKPSEVGLQNWLMDTPTADLPLEERIVIARDLEFSEAFIDSMRTKHTPKIEEPKEETPANNNEEFFPEA